jgi:hypothetical protein
MSVVSLTGNDTIVIAGRVLTDFGDADNATLEFPNELAAVKVGKNGNAIYALNATGRMADVVLRIIRGSNDDAFLNNLLAIQNANFAATVLLTGQFVKRVGNGLGGVMSDTYFTSGGIFSKAVNAQSNVEGDTEQSLAIYTLKFSNADRAQL